MSSQPTLVEMLEAGVHFGHQTSRWHPKMEPYIFGERGGIHIIDLEKTQVLLPEALEFMKGVVARGGKVLFIGTKSQAKGIVKKYAEACQQPYVINRWLGGTLTNFPQIKNSIRRLKTLKEQREKGELRKYTKKEQLLLDREIEDLEETVGGIQDLTSVPEAVFVVDIRTEKTAVEEATRTGCKVVAMCDTNVNPKNVDFVIPSNDDAVKAIEMIVHLVSDTLQEGMKIAGAAAVKKEASNEKKPAAAKVAAAK